MYEYSSSKKNYRANKNNRRTEDGTAMLEWILPQMFYKIRGLKERWNMELFTEYSL